jgi:hypothetical protein
MYKIKVSDGTLEALKWLALFAMLLDHVNKYIFNESLPFIYEVGRLCLPIFAFVISYKVARYSSIENGGYLRAVKRLVIFGILATPAFNIMVGYWPFNILFMFAIAISCMYFIDKGGNKNKWFAVLLFIFAGAFVEYWWWGIGLCLLLWRYFKAEKEIYLIAAMLVVALLFIVNRNYCALFALPIIYFSQFLTINVKRNKMIFYYFYPIHLTIICAIKYFI